MTRAGEAFAILTGGAFSGVDQSYDDDDEPKLEACRPNGERAPVAHLSEGARDQLYLALRLAYTEDYAARAEAPPFIGDDIFASFDDFRTGNGLEALARMGDRIQPILFTHHLHVVEAARVAPRRRRGHHSDRLSYDGDSRLIWMPAFAGMTNSVSVVGKSLWPSLRRSEAIQGS